MELYDSEMLIAPSPGLNRMAGLTTAGLTSFAGCSDLQGVPQTQCCGGQKLADVVQGHADRRKEGDKEQVSLG